MSESLAFPFAIALGLSMLGVDTAVSIMPRASTDNFFAVHSFRAERSGDTALIYIERAIKAPIPMAYTVRIMERDIGGWREFCKAQSNTFLYMPDAVLPGQIDLDWWTGGKCAKLPAAPARIVTTWDPEGQGLESVTAIAEVK